MKVNGKDARQRDLLAEATVAAHRQGLLCIAWFEYGFMAADGGTHNELRTKADWLTRTRDGSDVGKSNDFVWLNPFHPDVQQFLIDLGVEAAKDYDLDGVQLDDRLGLPVDLGYDDYTRKLYKQDTGRDVPADDNDVDWRAWRARKITTFALRYVSALRDANPELILSVSPAPYPWSYEHYLVDWKSWTRWCACGGHRWDEYVPQTYRATGAATTQAVGDLIARLDDDSLRDSIAPAIRVVGDEPTMSWDEVKSSIEFCRRQKLLGHAIWFSRGVLELYPTEFANFYDVDHAGPASNPLKPGNWRPLPIRATRAGGAAWRATLPRQGKYAVIARVGSGPWRIAAEIDASEPGERLLSVVNADVVELLVDRRP